MYHRYGRHGPRAWLLWRERHYVCPTTSLVSVARPIIIHVYIPVNAERVIFIVHQQQPSEINEGYTAQQVDGDTEGFKRSDLQGLQVSTNGQPSTLPDLEQEEIDIHLPNLSDAEQEVLQGLRTIAKLDASDRAQQEVQLGFENPPTLRQLEMDANQLARRFIRERVLAGKQIEHLELLIQVFVRLYTTIYTNEIGKYKDSGILLNDEEQRIRQTARIDKGDHAHHNAVLTNEFLRYFAVVRAMRELGLDSELSFSDLPRIDKYVRSYCGYYNQQIFRPKEVERPYEPGNF